MHSLFFLNNILNTSSTAVTTSLAAVNSTLAAVNTSSAAVGTNDILNSSSWSSSLGDLGRLFSLVISLFVVLALAYFTTRFLGKKRFGINKSTNISIIESHGVGYQSVISLVKVGSKFYLVGVTKETINLLAEVPEDDVALPKEIVRPTQSFETLLSNLIAKKKGDKNNDKS